MAELNKLEEEIKAMEEGLFNNPSDTDYEAVDGNEDSSNKVSKEEEVDKTQDETPKEDVQQRK